MIDYENNSKSSGIYQFRNLVNNKVYIGSSNILGNRKFLHLKDLRINDHPNNKFQNAFNKYGEDNFIFEILELCTKEELIIREQFYLDTLQPFDDNGYNILKIAKNSLGFKHSEETKNKISQLQIGKKISDTVKAMLLSYSKGRNVSDITREKLRVINTGKKHSEKTKAKIASAFSTPVCQYDLKDNLIECFSSIREAVRRTKVSHETISKSINNKKTRNYKWKRN